MEEILILIVIIFFMCLSISNNVDNYENNKISEDKPDEKLFFSCSHARYAEDSDYPFEEYPNSNYKIVKNSISEPLKGSYTTFKDIYNISDNDEEFYHSPICEESYEFNDNYKLQFRNIIEDSDDKEYLIDLEKYYDSQIIHNPYYVEGNPEYIGNKILYSPELKEKFLKIKLEMDKHHEDASHIHENYNDRYN
jgi:hypothetical protein